MGSYNLESQEINSVIEQTTSYLKKRVLSIFYLKLNYQEYITFQFSINKLALKI